MKILLIDDDPAEEVIIDRALKASGLETYELVYVDRCSTAMRHLNERAFDLILLDDRLSQTINAVVSVQMLKNTRFSAPIVISTNDNSASHLQDPQSLGVHEVISKSDVFSLLKRWISPQTATEAPMIAKTG